MMLAFVFPGQGSQYVGMGEAALKVSSRAREVFDVAEEITKLPLRKLCLEGPLAELTRTYNLQPALTAVNIAIYEAVKEQGVEPEMVAGHSLGEYSALYAAGVVGLEDVFRLVLKRGELMEREAQSHPGAMYAVIGLDRETLEGLVKEAQAKGVVALANHNSPEQIVITGEEEATGLAAGLAKEKGARVVKLKVSGAYHSPLMADAARDFAAFLEEIAFHAPKKEIFFNVSAASERNPEEIKKLMGRQIESPVRWVEEAEAMYQAGARRFVEIGPKNVLTNLLKKIFKGRPVHLAAVEDPHLIHQVLKVASGE
jgi:[acyl-carrier-protein] S-malonyltransferase